MTVACIFRSAFRALPPAAALMLFALAAEAGAVNTDADGVALKGYDAVAYFADGRPVPGAKDFEFRWMGATWRFASAAHRAAFEAAPAKYAPQYGGYCAYAVSQGATADADPDAWSVVDGRLFLNLSKSIQARWQKNIPGYVRSADANWPGIKAGLEK